MISSLGVGSAGVIVFFNYIKKGTLYDDYNIKDPKKFMLFCLVLMWIGLLSTYLA